MVHRKIYLELHEVGQDLRGISDTGKLKFGRFQMVVLSAYEQIRATRFDILNDVDEDGYERAFTSIRPGKNDVLVRACSR